MDVPSESEWTDFQNWTWAMPDQKGQPIVNNLYVFPHESNATNWKTSYSQPIYQINHDIYIGKGLWYSTFQISDQAQHHFVSHPYQGTDQFFEMEKIVEDQWMRYGYGEKVTDLDGFLWEIPINPYEVGLFQNEVPTKILSMNRTLPRSLPLNYPLGRQGGCSYIVKEPSTYVENVVDKVWEEVNDPQSTMGFLQIRRGDAINDCNTTIERLQSYFECTFSNTTKYGNITMLLGTDETNHTYINDVKSLLENMHPHVKLLHLDPIVEKQVLNFARNLESSFSSKRFVNNYFTFQVTTDIRYKRAAFSVEQRKRELCNDCDYLSRWSNVKWKKLVQ
jgi:hypothetical protein